MKHLKKKEKTKALVFIQIICIIVFIIAAAILGYYLYDYYKGQKSYSEIEKEITEVQDDGTFTVDWDALKNTNSEVVAWIRSNNGDISYPLVQTTDNEYYLTHSFTKENLRSGAIFMDTENAPDFTDDITYIYGHNMKDKSMFAKLNNYKDKSYYDENNGFVIYTPTATYYYSIFSTYNANVVNVEFPVTFATSEEGQAYLDEIAGKSNYDTKVAAEAGQSVVALFTCNGNDASRRVVYGILVKTEEQ